MLDLEVLENGQMVTRIVRESDYSPAAALFMVQKGSFLKILSRSKILTSIKGHNSVKNNQNIEGSNPNQTIVNAFIQLGEILSIPSQEIERK